MALQIWLPLTKDLRNQGLCKIIPTNNNAVYNATGGKLGGCYSFTNQTISLIPNTELKNSFDGEASISCWVKISTSHAAYAQCATYGLVSTAWTAIYFGIDINASGIPIGNVANGSNFTNCSFSTAIKDNQWHHLCLTYTTGTMKSYLDGVLKTTTSTSYVPAWTNATIFTVGGNSSEVFKNNDCMNDVRLYNHCLSSMEVKKLSQGLVLHYPLNRNGWGQENILLNTGFESRYTQSTGWDTTKNGTQLANSWGGYNSGVGNQATVYHAHLKEFNGEWVYEYIKTANESWLGISQSGLQSKLVAGETYTFSWEEYHVSGTNRVGTGLYYYKTGATSANFHLGIQQKGNVSITNQWQKCSYTFTAPSDADWSKSMSWYVYGHYNGNGTFYVRHIKLEKGSVATPWCPNSSDALATTMGLNSTIEYDCSGFCNNGTYSALPTVTSDTPKYNVSSLFGAYNTPNLITNTASTLCPALSNCTIAWWQKSNGAATLLLTGQTTSYYVAASNANTYYHQNAGSPTMYRDGVAGTYQNTTGVWHHYVLTGVNLSTWTTLKVNSYGSGWPVNGYISDFRIYATALSADDVKSLYQNCATIDPDGTIRGKIR